LGRLAVLKRLRMWLLETKRLLRLLHQESTGCCWARAR
jgi:hypothetical protein